MTIDVGRAEAAIRSFLTALGYDPVEHPELAGTPALVAEAWAHELLSGRTVDVERLLDASSVPPEGKSELVVVRELSVVTLCPHHLMPAEGRATVAYLPGRRLLGLGTIARLVDAFCRQLTLQERIGQRVVAALMEHGGARGAACHLRLEHACLRARGAKATNAVVETVHTAGELEGDSPSARMFLAILGRADS
jgi:GTP cyclohydrolase IA